MPTELDKLFVPLPPEASEIVFRTFGAKTRKNKIKLQQREQIAFVILRKNNIVRTDITKKKQFENFCTFSGVS